MQRCPHCSLKVKDVLPTLGVNDGRSIIAETLETVLKLLRRRDLFILRPAPYQALNAKSANAGRKDAAASECLYERYAVVKVVVTHQLMISGDNRAEIFAEGNVGRRTIIQSPNAHIEHVLRRLGRFSPQPVDQVGMNRPRPQHAAATGGEPQEIGGAPAIDGKEGIEYGSDQDAPALVRLESVLIFFRLGLVWLPDVGLFIHFPDGVAKCGSAAGGPAELGGQLTKKVFLAVDLPASGRNLMANDLRKCEMLKEGNAVGESFVEGSDVEIAGEEELAVHAIQKCVRRLVRD